MKNHVDPKGIDIREHRLGRFDRRLPIGPARWPFHDLLWIHEGSVSLDFGEEALLVLSAPMGVLILPQTPFSGVALGGYATASICHFDWPDAAAYGLSSPGFLRPRAAEVMHVQSMLRLSLQLAADPAPSEPYRRRRLLVAILDCFDVAGDAGAALSEDADQALDLAWQQAAISLGKMRTLSDVAALMEVHESAFRARHRRQYNTSAGSHLREMRLRRAEDLLATTRLTIAEIAIRIGYGHAETFIAAFHRSRGCTPRQFRHRSNPFA